MDFEEARKYLDRLTMFGVKLGLDNMKKLVQEFDDPLKGMKVVHVAGTTGKGSVSTMMASILTEAGRTTGLYTSPHLRTITERVSVDRENISDEDYVRLLGQVKDVADGMKPHPTYFEVTTMVAFLHFKEKGCDHVVLEAGLGGRLDATNVVASDVAIITTIDLDHTEHLGRSLTDIAREKAGIIKPGSSVVVGKMKEEPVEVIEGVCRVRKAEIIKRAKARVVTIDDRGQDMIVTTHDKRIIKLHLDIYGRFQADNAALAVSAAEALGIRESKYVELGLRKAATMIHGRLERVREDPPVYIDVAHNPISFEVLARSMETLPEDRDICMVIGLLKDKDHKGIMKAVAGICSRIYVCKPETERAQDPVKPAHEAEKYCNDVRMVDDVKEAVQTAMDHARHANQTVVVCGSFYTVGEALDLLDPREYNI